MEQSARRLSAISAALLAMTVVPHTVLADSASGGTGSPAAVNLDFKVTIPAILRFQVGSIGTVDEIVFDVSAANLGDGSDIAGTGGDKSNGQVTVDLFSNGGQVTIVETNNSGGTGLADGTGNYIPYTEILASTSDTGIPAPELSDAGGNTASPTPTSGNGKVTSYTETWTYTYDNTAVYPAGDYGTSGNGGRVTYTASLP